MDGVLLLISWVMLSFMERSIITCELFFPISFITEISESGRNLLPKSKAATTLTVSIDDSNLNSLFKLKSFALDSLGLTILSNAISSLNGS